MKKPQPIDEITVKALADIANLTAQRIYQLASEGRLPAIKNGKLPRDESITALFKFYQRDSEELKRERLLLIAANRQTKELELEAAKARYIDKAVARASIIAFAQQYKAIVRQQIELSGPQLRRAKLLELGVVDDVVQRFNAFDVTAEQTVIDRIADQCAAASKTPIE